MAWGAKTRAVILLLLRNTRERALKNYESLNPSYRKRVKIWMLIPGRITWLSLEERKTKVNFHQYLGTSLGKKENKTNNPWFI